MALLSLTEMERSALQDILKRAREARVVKRAQVLLWLDAGEAPPAIAQRLTITRQTVYNWVRAFQTREGQSLLERLRDGARSGRPPTKRAAITALIKQLWEQSPGAVTPETADIPRTAPALQRRLAQEGMAVNERTIRSTLRQLNYSYKRPRYVLARRSKTWRQQKGGSNEG
jgi:transposase